MEVTKEQFLINTNDLYNSKRKSGVELLKIIAILLICVSHAVQTSEQFVDFFSATTNGYNIEGITLYRSTR